jgi:hypothetical protein
MVQTQIEFGRFIVVKSPGDDREECGFILRMDGLGETPRRLVIDSMSEDVVQ